jgi:hypothetical protein
MKHRLILSFLILALHFSAQGQSMQDCFLNDFTTRNAVIPIYHDTSSITDIATAEVTVTPEDTLGKVSPYLFGNNANIWMGQMVTESALLRHIRTLKPKILRFPGGNASSEYFWNAPKNQPPSDVPDSVFDTYGKKIPASVSHWWFGQNYDNWTLSVDNYYSMLDSTNCTGIITANYSYARYGTGPNPVATAAHLAAEWVRYDRGRTKFWEIGNENAGIWQAGYEIDTLHNQDGQPRIITGEIYGNHFLVFVDSMKQAASEIGTTIYIGAQLIESSSAASSEPGLSWNSGFFKQAGNSADFFIVHSYYTPYNANSPASTVLNSGTSNTDNMINYIKNEVAKNQVIMKPLALTEWNIFAVGSKQMVSFVCGMQAAIVLGEMANKGYSMASRWDLANGYSTGADAGNDHGLFNVGDEPGVPKWNPRPAFFYMYYFQKFFGDHAIYASATGGGSRIPTMLAFASIFNSGHLGIMVVNKGTTDQVTRMNINNYGVGNKFYIFSLLGGTDNGEYSPSVYVNGIPPTNATGGPINVLENIPAMAYTIGNEIKFASPARSIQFILVEPGTQILTSVKESESIVIADQYALQQNYPNPFNPQTTISFSIGKQDNVILKIYDMLGREIATLVNEHKNAGAYEVHFNGSALSSGIYYYRLQTSQGSQIKKMLLLK